MALRLSTRRPHPAATAVAAVLVGAACSLGLVWAVRQAPPAQAAWLAGLAGLAASLGMALVLRRLAIAQRNADALTHHLTRDLERMALLAQETTNIVVITDARRRITWVNEAFERATGYGAMEVLGRSPGAVLQCEETSQDTVRELREALDAGRPHRCQLLNRGKDGRRYWVDFSVQPLRDAQGRLEGFMAIEADITESRAMEIELRRNAALLRAAIEAIDEAFVLYDPDDRLVYCNERYRNVYATSADLLVPGARFEDIIRTGAQRGQYREAIGRVEEWVAERMARHQAAETTVLQTTDDGRVLRVREHRLQDGHLVGFRIDVTDLMRARQTAERADKAKTEFIRTISHELRTPLQSIIGFSELGLHFAREHAAMHGMFSDVLAGGRRMLRLVNGLLDINKIESTAGTLDLRRGDLGDLLAEVAHEMRPLLAARGLRLDLPRGMPPLLALIEPDRMRQVLHNLLDNAIRFAPHGSAIEVECPDLGSDQVGLALRDHGPGIPENELETIFEPFVQSSRTRSGAGGTGLGLTLCRRIVQAHGGRIEASVPDGGGARFTLSLPAMAAGMAVACPTTDTADTTNSADSPASAGAAAVGALPARSQAAAA